MDKESISVCGLDCDINKMISDSEADERTIVWFRSRGWLKENEGMDKVLGKRMDYTGCLGDRKTYWSPSCEILIRCHDGKRFKYRSECPDFPCDLLTDRAGKSERYRAALELLSGRAFNSVNSNQSDRHPSTSYTR